MGTPDFLETSVDKGSKITVDSKSAFNIVCFLVFVPLCISLPHCIRVGLCDQQNTGKVVACGFWGFVIEDVLLLVCSLGLLSRKSQPPPHKDVEAAWERPLWGGTEASHRRQACTWQPRGEATLEIAALAPFKSSHNFSPREHLVCDFTCEPLPEPPC